MPGNRPRQWRTTTGRLPKRASSLIAIILLPIVFLSLYRLAGENASLVAAFVSSSLALVLWQTRSRGAASNFQNSFATGLVPKTVFSERILQFHEIAIRSDKNSAIFSIELDDAKTLAKHFGQEEIDAILQATGKKIAAVFRDGDVVSLVNDRTFEVCLQPIKQLDLETCTQLAGRIQSTVEEPISEANTNIYLTSCVGFAQIRQLRSRSAESWHRAARTALAQAQRNGHGSIRVFTDKMPLAIQKSTFDKEDLSAALASGQIIPWFQPQISTDTGRITGFEALARWDHPTRGMIPPVEFLDAIERSGLLERLAEVMLFHSFTALKNWDAAGADVPGVGVNFAGPELHNPHLADKIAWELDRFELSPDRLSVEVLETVVSDAPDDIVTRNIKKLRELGCKIDLDDFGTGHASITSIRRFAVDRIKIDRSFIAKADRDPEQQRMISAILTMAEHLDIETLAEGVETVGEHALLAQLGCGHVQGYGIAKPMPYCDTAKWMAKHNLKLKSTEQIIGNKLR